MTKVGIICAVVAVLAGALTLQATAEEQGVAGRWTGTATGITGSRQFREEFTMVLMLNGQNVTGTYSSKVETGGRKQGGAERTDVPVHGTLTGNTLSLVMGQQGKQGTLEATVNGDSMSGSLARGNSEPHDVFATRAK